MMVGEWIEGCVHPFDPYRPFAICSTNVRFSIGCVGFDTETPADDPAHQNDLRQAAASGSVFVCDPPKMLLESYTNC